MTNALQAYLYEPFLALAESCDLPSVDSLVRSLLSRHPTMATEAASPSRLGDVMERVVGHVFGHDRAGADHGLFADGDTTEDDGIGSDPSSAANVNRTRDVRIRQRRIDVERGRLDDCSARDPHV